jgi:hypothetical protein
MMPGQEEKTGANLQSGTMQLDSSKVEALTRRSGVIFPACNAASYPWLPATNEKA